jgi:hypothetical protein
MELLKTVNGLLRLACKVYAASGVRGPLVGRSLRHHRRWFSSAYITGISSARRVPGHDLCASAVKPAKAIDGVLFPQLRHFIIHHTVPFLRGRIFVNKRLQRLHGCYYFFLAQENMPT